MVDFDSHEHTTPAKRTFGWWVWQIVFVLMYPVLVTFSVLFTSIVWVFSGISRLLFLLLKNIAPREK